MAVTKQVYTATAAWTASQLATIFESAFVASGLMTAWYDSFTSGSVENRILEVVYDGGATYGTTYYWFMFKTDGTYISISGTWDAVSHVPTGTQYLDYFSTTTNSTNNHLQLLSLSSASDASVIRYTSAVDATQSWYAIVQGSSSFVFTIPPASFTIAPWVDLDKVLFHHTLRPAVATVNNAGLMSFVNYGGIRRSFWIGGALAGFTSSPDTYNHAVASYASPGRINNTPSNNLTSISGVAATGTLEYCCNVIVPMGNTAANPAYSSNFSPVFTQMPFSAYISTPNLASDFGIAFHYANNTMVRGDKLIVTSSMEEWEILAVSNNATVTGGASPMFLARVV